MVTTYYFEKYFDKPYVDPNAWQKVPYFKHVENLVKENREMTILHVENYFGAYSIHLECVSDFFYVTHVPSVYYNPELREALLNSYYRYLVGKRYEDNSLRDLCQKVVDPILADSFFRLR